MTAVKKMHDANLLRRVRTWCLTLCFQLLRSVEYSKTVSQINNELRIRLPHKPHVQRTTVDSALIGQLMFLKKLEDLPYERNTERTKESRRDFATWLLNDSIQRHELVYIDETRIDLYLAHIRGLAPIFDNASAHR